MKNISNPVPTRIKGFTLVELLTMLAISAVLSGLVPGMLSGPKNSTHASVDLDNGRQIMAATAIYANENGDTIPYPGWGLGGLSGWAYTTTANSFTTNVSPFSRIPDGAGNDKAPGVADSAYQRQLPYFYGGQLGPILRNPKTLMCSKDVAEISALKRTSWAGRSLKLTSYCWNAYIIDLGQRQVPHKVSAFRPVDILGWEASEAEPFNFNDSANQPYEGLSQRHGESTFVRGAADRDLGGSGLVFRFDGSSSHLSWRRFVSMAGGAGGAGAIPQGIVAIPPTSPDNSLFIGPGFH